MVWGRVPGHPGRPDLAYVQLFHIDWTECPRDRRAFPRDKRDTSTGWLQSRSGGVPPNLYLSSWRLKPIWGCFVACFVLFNDYSLGPAKIYILRRRHRPMQLKLGEHDRQLDNSNEPR